MKKQILEAMYALGNVPMSVEMISLKSGLDAKDVHRHLLDLHLSGHLNGGHIKGLKIPRRRIESERLFGPEFYEKKTKSRKRRSVAE